MEYNSGDNIQFIVFYDDKLEILFGKITNVAKGNLKVALSEPSFEKSGLKQEVVTISRRHAGRIVQPDEPVDKVVFHWVTFSRVGRLARFEAPGEVLVDRIADINLACDNTFVYHMEKKGSIPASKILDTRAISESQRSDPNLRQTLYMAKLYDMLTKLDLARREVRTIKDVPMNDSRRALGYTEDEVYWYGFVFGNRYFDCTGGLRLRVREPSSPCFLKFVQNDDSATTDTYDIAPPERSFILTRDVPTKRETENPPVKWLSLEDPDYQGFETFFTFFTTKGAHKIFEGRPDFSIIKSCKTREGDATIFSDLMTGYFTKSSQLPVVREFISTHLWFLKL